MFSFLLRHRAAIAGIGFAGLALGFLVSHRGVEGGVPGPLGLVGAPVQAVARGMADGIGSVVDRYVFLLEAGEEAARLRREVADLRRELLAVEEVVQENERLRKLAGFRETTDLPLVPARVVGRSASAWFRTVVLDKGSDDGVGPDAPVLTPGGVVGRVYEVSPDASRVLLLTDPNFAVDAIVQRTRAQVVIEGRLDDRCRILYLARGEDVRPGDRVVTSGMGGVFPKGLFVGEVARAEAVPGEVFQRAELAPGADLSRLEEVFVVPAPGEENPP